LCGRKKSWIVKIEAYRLLGKCLDPSDEPWINITKYCDALETRNEKGISLCPALERDGWRMSMRHGWQVPTAPDGLTEKKESVAVELLACKSYLR